MFAFEYSRKTEKSSTDQLMPDPELLIEEDLDPLRYYEEILVPLYRQLHRTDLDQILQTVNKVTDHLIRHPPADASLRRILQDTAVFLEELDLWANEKTREQRLLVYAESCSDQ
ncbi:MAG: hypothetical protein K6A40_00710 [Solobacterium sp.]|nr:hypothetical protein [Solobacterium sp.]